MGASAFSKADKQVANNPTLTKRLSFTRDKAGWNNVRITFESLVCVARLTKRLLVIPPASYIDHVADAPFHELHVYDSASLASVVSFEAGTDDTARRANFHGSLDDFVRADRGGTLDADVVLCPNATRIQHFECLSLSARDKRIAAETVLKLRLLKDYERAAEDFLKRAGLVQYHAVHLRRGDFAQFRPDTQWSGADLQGRVRASFPRAESEWPLLVACCVTDGQRDPFPELAATLRERRVMRTDEFRLGGSSQSLPLQKMKFNSNSQILKDVVIDTLLLTKANSFAGTPDSTFSTPAERDQPLPT